MPLPFAGLPLVVDRSRAGNGTRTRDPNLGKVVLYQLSYSRARGKLLWPSKGNKSRAGATRGAALPPAPA